MSQNKHFTIYESANNADSHSLNSVVTFQNSIADNQPTHGRNFSLNAPLKLYIISDIVALLLSFSSALIFELIINNTYTGNNSLFLSQIFSMNQLTSFSAIAVGVIVWFAYNGHYRTRIPFWMEAKDITKYLCFALIINGFLQFALKQDISRLLTITSWIIAIFAVIGLRTMVRKMTAKRRIFQIPTVIIGSGDTAQRARAAIESAPEMGYNIIAQIKNLPEAFLLSGRSWSNICEKYEVQHVIIALDGQELEGTEKIMAKLVRESISFSVAPPIQNFPVAGMKPQYFLGHNTMLLTHTNALEQHIPQLIKRVLDIAISGTALILLSPVILVIVALIKLNGGSAFFGHNRIGRAGKVFSCLKFRSMVIDSDAILKKHLAENPEAAAEWKATQKLQNDPRVTRLGRLLRSTSIDELPQLINVLRGDMSLVGPRPIVRSEISHYDREITHYYRVRPGVTGLWQVSGRNDVSYTQRVQMDSWYVRNWSLWHDIAILFKTVPAVLKRSGAY